MVVKSRKQMVWTKPTANASLQRLMNEQARIQLATRIKQLREMKGWSAERLARESDVSIGTISRLENAKTEDPREGSLRALAQAFEMTREDLAGPRLSPEEVDEVMQTQLDRIEDGLKATVGWLEAIGQEMGVRPPEGVASLGPQGDLGRELEDTRSNPASRERTGSR